MLQRAPETSQREILNYLSSFDMLNCMGIIVKGVINLLRLYCMADVTYLDILEITKKKKPSRIDFCYPDVLKTWQQSTPKLGIKNG